MGATEALALGVLVVLGLLLARDMLRLHRGSPDLFRGGPIVFRRSVILAQVPSGVPTPIVSTGLLYKAQYRVLGPEEVGFTAQTFNTPLLLGRLHVSSSPPTLNATGRLYWGVWSAFFFGFPLIGFPWQALLMMYAFLAFGFIGELRAFARVVQQVAHAINQKAA